MDNQDNVTPTENKESPASNDSKGSDNLHKYFKSILDKWGLATIPLVAAIVLIWLYISPAPSVGVQITVESSRIELGQVLPSWSIRSKEDTNVSLQSDRYVALSRIDSLNGIGLPEELTQEETRIYAAKLLKNPSPFVRLDNLSFSNTPVQLTLHRSSNYFKMIMKDADDHPSHLPLRIYGRFFAPAGSVVQASEKPSLLDEFQPIEVIFNSKGEDETEWTFSASTAKRNPGLLQFSWLDIPVKGSISFREPSNNQQEANLPSTIRNGKIRILETEKEVDLHPRDFMDITLDKESIVSVDIISMDNALKTIITGRVAGLTAGRDAYHPDLIPSRLEVLAKSNRIVLVCTILSALATLLISVLSLKRSN